MAKRKKKKIVPERPSASLSSVGSSDSTLLPSPSSVQSGLISEKVTSSPANSSSLKNLTSLRGNDEETQIEKKEKDKSEIAFLEKLKGDEDFQKRDFLGADVKYSKGIAFSPHNKLLVSLLTNRAITNLVLKVKR